MADSADRALGPSVQRTARSWGVRRSIGGRTLCPHSTDGRRPELAVGYQVVWPSATWGFRCSHHGRPVPHARRSRQRKVPRVAALHQTHDQQHRGCGSLTARSHQRGRMSHQWLAEVCQVRSGRCAEQPVLYCLAVVGEDALGPSEPPSRRWWHRPIRRHDATPFQISRFSEQGFEHETRWYKSDPTFRSRRDLAPGLLVAHH